MIRRLAFAALLALLAPAAAFGGSYVETPSLQAEVDAGKLPSVAERLPKNPRVLDLEAMGRESGQHGGRIRMLLGGQNDIRLMTLYGYSRFVGFDKDLKLQPDILESYDVEDGRIFTFKLREGHKWSDGHPFTSEDIRYAWEDVISNETLTPSGPDREMLVDGQPPKFEAIDERTVRFSWDKPNPDFLPALAAARPIFLAMPAHYLKNYHEKYQDKDQLAKLAKEAKVKDWSKLHTRMARQYRPENPDLPTLDPWRNSIAPPSDQFVFVRNPFYHRVDAKGHQLPYADEVVLNMGSGDLIPAKTGAGDADLQARYLRFDNYTFLKEAEKRLGIRVRLWKSGGGSAVALLPNLNYEDEAWRNLFRDVRFRRALSLAINRQEINEIVYFGLAHESADTILPESPMFKEEYRTAWSGFDLEAANALLDEIGLTKRDVEGYRLLPDGRRAEIIVENSGEGTLESDVLELITDYWRKIGVKLYTRTSQRDVLRSRVVAGQTMMSVWSGIDNAIVTADMSPMELAPTNQAQLQWPQWGLFYESNGSNGQKADMPEAERLLDLLRQWRQSADEAGHEAAWNEILKLRADQVFSIGTVNGTLQPVVTAGKLKNVPEEQVYSFEPGGYFGRFMPDTFFYASE